MARSVPPSGQSNGNPSPPAEESTVSEVELLRVQVSRKGSQVDAQWAIHPQLKQDLLPNEWQEVTDLMGKVAGIVGHRFSQILSQADSDPPSNA
ncbi:conserved protein of unknown function [Nitrospira japonica]|uniref:Uncharacterized protein n=1 Tax=Nitrospira japonica TaxID=1325564 RepID=A0A1W1I2L2_9BACT|nr:hypothetical protein [Nitrospira japonica]SLM47232.1 conserved protein of unknown function [Nitrospira japonica]